MEKQKEGICGSAARHVVAGKDLASQATSPGAVLVIQLLKHILIETLTFKAPPLLPRLREIRQTRDGAP
jgi:hypothetical protein